MIYIIGIGMDGEKTLTSEAKKAIEESDIMIGAERMIGMFELLEKKTYITYNSDEISNILRNEEYSNAAILMSGDIGFYSGASKLIDRIGDLNYKLICGISSFSYFCAATGICYENTKLFSLHGTNDSVAIKVKMNEKCFFLLDNINTPDEICKRLLEYNLGEVNVLIGENLCGKNEKIYKGKAADYIETKFGKLSVMITINSKYLSYDPIGISDAEFIRGNVPMTKSLVRGAVVSGLKIHSDSVCWDIGCGTGSVSVEMAYKCVNSTVYSFDKSEDALNLTKINSKKFGCDNIVPILGICPSCFSGIPAPDKVFVGGSSGNLCDILDYIYTLNNNVDITINAVTLETLNVAISYFKKKNIKCSFVQILVNETKNIGKYTMFAAQNPVFVIKGYNL